MKEYNISFWMYDYKYDSDVDYNEVVQAESLDQAKQTIKNKYSRARNLKQL